MADIIEAEFPFSSYFHVFLLFEKIAETEEMDGLALRVRQRCQIKLGHRNSLSPHKWNSTAIWWLLHDSWKMPWLSQASIWRTGIHSTEGLQRS